MRLFLMCLHLMCLFLMCLFPYFHSSRLVISRGAMQALMESSRLSEVIQRTLDPTLPWGQLAARFSVSTGLRFDEPCVELEYVRVTTSTSAQRTAIPLLLAVCAVTLMAGDIAVPVSLPRFHARVSLMVVVLAPVVVLLFACAALVAHLSLRLRHVPAMSSERTRLCHRMERIMFVVMLCCMPLAATLVTLPTREAAWMLTSCSVVQFLAIVISGCRCFLQVIAAVFGAVSLLAVSALSNAQPRRSDNFEKAVFTAPFLYPLIMAFTAWTERRLRMEFCAVVEGFRSLQLEQCRRDALAGVAARALPASFLKGLRGSPPQPAATAHDRAGKNEKGATRPRSVLAVALCRVSGHTTDQAMLHMAAQAVAMAHDLGLEPLPTSGDSLFVAVVVPSRRDHRRPSVGFALRLVLWAERLTRSAEIEGSGIITVSCAIDALDAPDEGAGMAAGAPQTASLLALPTVRALVSGNCFGRLRTLLASVARLQDARPPLGWASRVLAVTRAPFRALCREAFAWRAAHAGEVSAVEVNPAICFTRLASAGRGVSMQCAPIFVPPELFAAIATWEGDRRQRLSVAEAASLATRASLPCRSSWLGFPAGGNASLVEELACVEATLLSAERRTEEGPSNEALTPPMMTTRPSTFRSFTSWVAWWTLTFRNRTLESQYRNWQYPSFAMGTFVSFLLVPALLFAEFVAPYQDAWSSGQLPQWSQIAGITLFMLIFVAIGAGVLASVRSTRRGLSAVASAARSADGSISEGWLDQWRAAPLVTVDVTGRASRSHLSRHGNVYFDAFLMELPLACLLLMTLLPPFFPQPSSIFCLLGLVVPLLTKRDKPFRRLAMCLLWHGPLGIATTAVFLSHACGGACLTFLGTLTIVPLLAAAAIVHVTVVEQDARARRLFLTTNAMDRLRCATRAQAILIAKMTAIVCPVDALLPLIAGAEVEHRPFAPLSSGRGGSLQHAQSLGAMAMLSFRPSGGGSDRRTTRRRCRRHLREWHGVLAGLLRFFPSIQWTSVSDEGYTFLSTPSQSALSAAVVDPCNATGCDMYMDDGSSRDHKARCRALQGLDDPLHVAVVEMWIFGSRLYQAAKRFPLAAAVDVTSSSTCTSSSPSSSSSCPVVLTLHLGRWDTERSTFSAPVGQRTSNEALSSARRAFAPPLLFHTGGPGVDGLVAMHRATCANPGPPLATACASRPFIAVAAEAAAVLAHCGSAANPLRRGGESSGGASAPSTREQTQIFRTCVLHRVAETLAHRTIPPSGAKLQQIYVPTSGRHIDAFVTVVRRRNELPSHLEVRPALAAAHAGQHHTPLPSYLPSPK